jgi:hyperosmotically inducible protein
MKKMISVIALLTAGVLFAQSDETTARLNKEVRHELVMLPYFGVFDNLEYRIDGHKVTLLGQVVRPTLKSNAEYVVKRIEGVAAVDNQIEILPLFLHDERLRLSLYRAIYGYPALSRYAMPVLKPIHIIVKSGNVTLEGVVDNETDKNLVKIRALGVHGTLSVTNNLQVETVSVSSLAKP